MMTNLFSSFDPSTNSIISLNWLSMMLLIIFININFWFTKNKVLKILSMMLDYLFKEFKVIISSNKSFSVILMSIFLFIVINNFLGLFPYIFTSTSHMAISMSMAIPIWLGLMLFGWINFNKDMFAHLVPQSTPVILMPFMVLIESISNVIRPLTLSIRLSANMIAGHLLMTLLGNQLSSSVGLTLGVMLVVQLLLVTLEMAVSIIQAYVFSILMTLYVGEVGSH